jgi:hypothetical protein
MRRHEKIQRPLVRASLRVAMVLAIVGALFVHLPVQAQTEPDGGPADFFSYVGDAAADTAGAAVVANLAAAPTTRRVSLASAHPEFLDRNEVNFNVFGEHIVFTTERVEAKGTKWFGSDGAGGSAVIVHTGQAMAGTITTSSGAHYSIRPVRGDLVAVVDVDTSAYLPEGESALGGGGGLLEPADAAPNADDGSLFTVIVAYTAAARVANGGTAGIVALITLAETESNTAYANSAIAPRMDVVHMYETPTAEAGAGSGSDFSADLYRFTELADGFYDEVHSLRNTHKADFAVLVTAYTTPSLCGIGFLDSRATTAFSVNDHDCITGNYTFSHEIGHNIGARHDDDSTGLFGYDRGYVFTGNPSGTPWRTIMGKGTSCAWCTRIQHFSNPGVSFDGSASGTASTNDTARVHDERAFTVANFRSGPVSNDDFADATVLDSASGSTAGSNTGATGEAGEPNHADASLPLESAWWTFTPPADGTLHVDTIGSSYDTTLALYTGSAVDALTEVAANDDFSEFVQSGVDLAVTGGTTYSIAVDGFANETGAINLNWAMDASPPVPPALPHTVGLVDPTQGKWYLRNGSGQVTSFFYGNPGDLPVAGDWDGDGIATPGLFRQSDGFFYARNSNTQGPADAECFAGNPADIPIVGDWDGDGDDNLGIYRPSEQIFYLFTSTCTGSPMGAAQISFVFGNPGDKPVAGDWDGDGIDEIGLHRESTGLFYWRNTLDTGNADGTIFFGDPGDRFVAGDWGIVDDKDTPAVFRPSNTAFFFRHTLTQGNADSQFVFGQPGWLPVAGDFGLD